MNRPGFVCPYRHIFDLPNFNNGQIVSSVSFPEGTDCPASARRIGFSTDGNPVGDSGDILIAHYAPPGYGIALLTVKSRF